MLNSQDEDQKRRLFGDIDTLVKIQIEGKDYQVPLGLELLRCFQFLDFNIAFEHFCWNASCENCASTIVYPDATKEKVLACQEPAVEGLSIPKLPDQVEIPSN